MAGYEGSRESQGERKPLNLAPRSISANAAAERKSFQSQNSIFGEARPREEILATRRGKAEKEILEEEALHERLHLRLSGSQLKDKNAIESKIEELQIKLVETEDVDLKQKIETEIQSHIDKLETLIENFEQMAINTAHEGGGVPPSARQPRHGGGRGEYGGGRGEHGGGRGEHGGGRGERSERGRGYRNDMYRTRSDELYVRGREREWGMGRERGGGRNMRGRGRNRERGRERERGRGRERGRNNYGRGRVGTIEEDDFESLPSEAYNRDGDFFDNFSGGRGHNYHFPMNQDHHNADEEDFSHLRQYSNSGGYEE